MSCNTTDVSDCDVCPENDVHPNPFIMAVRFLVFGAATIFGAMQMIKGGKKKELLAWLGGWGLFLTIPRYLICASCSGYGKMCYSYYIGKYTSMIFPKREKDVPMSGFALEVLSLSAITFAPALAMREDRKKLMTYLILMDLVMAGQFFHACRYCGTHAEDEFKMHCPNHRFWRSFR
jgi:hypothetical protein